ncbi:uncharacterized protein LOC131040764 isoform X3 [Cryptomeria japonica]|uniref:uncharacterized protein LOC131040764 isoform X3 n=1 Tax=Cryptomeria japonica TaxID=3369 RepID=UPI0027DA26BF|nr:uncharacterized protein LOC131040764 isoform X3 [Cryptomeria japonica]
MGISEGRNGAEANPMQGLCCYVCCKYEFSDVAILKMQGFLPDFCLYSVQTLLLRVKVYRLSDDGKWDDRGTGHVSVEYLEQPEAVGLVVIDEEDNETLLVHRICANDVYKRNEDTIIAWRDPEIATELALSFQESMGCSFVWEQICSVQRSIQFPNVGGTEIGPRPPNDEVDHAGNSQGNDDAFHGGISELRELPQVDSSTLPLILKTVTEGCIMDHIRVSELIVQDHAFLPKLLELFKIYEDLENTDGLHLIFKIVKGIIMLNSSQIFEKIFSDEYIMDIVGALEYDPEILCRQEHRAFLREQVVFKEAVPIRDPSLLSKIHQAYRVGYIKDVILPRVLDEGTFAAMNGIIHSNNVSVVSALKDDVTFIHELFSTLKSPDTPDPVKKNLILFLQEFCSLAKGLLLVQQMRLFRELVDEGLFEVITSALQSEEKLLRLTGTDILIVILNQDPSLLRTFLVQKQGGALLGLLVKGMCTDFGEDMHCQFLEIIRMLLDPYTMPNSQREIILDVFYDFYMDWLVDVITISCPGKEGTETSRKSSSSEENGRQVSATPEILSNITDLLCFCVMSHSYRINRCYFLRNNVLEKVLRLTRRKEKYLVVAAVRFLRTIISRNDDFFHRHVVSNNLFEPIIQAFTANGNRYNLLNSAVLELIEYIRKENIKSLIEYLVKNFSDQMEKFDCVGTFKALKLRYEQTLEAAARTVSGGKGEIGSNPINPLADPRKRSDERALEKEEEDYFNEDSDDEEDTASARTAHISAERGHAASENGSSCLSDRPIGLVDYEDEDDDTPVPESISKEASELKSTCTKSSAPGNDNKEDGDTSVLQNVAKEPPESKTISAVSSVQENQSLGHEEVAKESPKRKLNDGSRKEVEPGSSKKRKLHLNSKDSAVSVDSVDGSQQCIHDGTNLESGSLKAVDTRLETSAGEVGQSVVSRENSNGEINIAEARDGIGNHGESPISREGSALDRQDSGVKGNSPLKGKGSDGRVNSPSADLVRAGPPSPEPYTVR